MKSLQAEISQFMEDQSCPFTNWYGVAFDYDDEGFTINACCGLPAFCRNDQYNLELLYPFHPLKAFITRFSIHSLESLKNLHSRRIERMYYSGHVQLWCHIYPSERYLIFQKKGLNILVTDDHDMDHTLSSPLINAEDFHAYTRYYYSA